MHTNATSTVTGVLEGDRGAASDMLTFFGGIFSGSVYQRLGMGAAVIETGSAATVVEGVGGKPTLRLADNGDLGAHAQELRRAELNARFGRSGDLNQDINERGLVDSVRRNSSEAVQLTRADVASGVLKPSSQSFGTRAHTYFEWLNEKLGTRVSGLYRVLPEQFRNAAGAIVPRRNSGSIGTDVLIEPWNQATARWNFDLKTHGGVEVPISSQRQAQFTIRFGIPAQELYQPR
jgi:hypothetical protein